MDGNLFSSNISSTSQVRQIFGIVVGQTIVHGLQLYEEEACCTTTATQSISDFCYMPRECVVEPKKLPLSLSFLPSCAIYTTTTTTGLSSSLRTL